MSLLTQYATTAAPRRSIGSTHAFGYSRTTPHSAVLSYAPHLKRLHEVARLYPHTVSAEGAAEILL
jgi:hypothetical protein